MFLGPKESWGLCHMWASRMCPCVRVAPAEEFELACWGEKQGHRVIDYLPATYYSSM